MFDFGAGESFAGTDYEIDLTDASPTRWESVAATLEAGTGVYAGVLATDGSTSDTIALRT